MPGERNDLQNSIKYSMWETRTDEKQSEILESPELIEGFNRDSNKEMNKKG